MLGLVDALAIVAFTESLTIIAKKECKNMPRQRKTDKAKLNEGRGTGIGMDYEPWIKIHEFGSKGRSHRVVGWKQRRLHQFLSDLEFHYFLLMQWEDSVVDIREQFPLLPLEQTISIADDLGVKHQPKNSKEKIVLTTDFLLTVNNGDENIDVARTIKQESELLKYRTVEKFKIEQAFWKHQNIDWGIVNESQISKTFARNIYSIYNDYFWAEEHGYSEIDIALLVYSFKNELVKNSLDVIKTSEDFEQFQNWPEGTGLRFFKFLLAQKHVGADFNKKFNFDTMLPLVV